MNKNPRRRVLLVTAIATAVTQGGSMTSYIVKTQSVLLCILLASSVVFAQVQNGGFEEWNDEESPEGWMIEKNGYEKTVDAYKGKFAVKLFNWYQHLPGNVETGIETKESLTPGFAFIKAPTVLTGYYKYVGQAEQCATAGAAVVFYKASEQNPKHYDRTAKIGNDLSLTDQYTRFELKIAEDKVPKEVDRISVRFETAGRCGQEDNNCCDLYLDEIELK